VRVGRVKVQLHLLKPSAWVGPAAGLKPITKTKSSDIAGNLMHSLHTVVAVRRGGQARRDLGAAF